MGALDDKVIAICGAGGGVGRTAALALAAEGAKLLVNDLGADKFGEGTDPAVADAIAKDVRGAGGTAEAHFGTSATDAGATAVVDACVKAFGRIDALVYAA